MAILAKGRSPDPSAQGLWRRRRREAVTAHDLRHLCAIRRLTGRRGEHVGRLAEELRTERGRRDYAERLHILVAVVVQRRIIAGLNAGGLDDLRVPHMAVLQFPGPDGVRPSLLAERAGMSKQAMNQLLGSLENLGYIVRSDVPGEGRARIVRFTRRGHAAYAKIHDILRDIEREWGTALGSRHFAELKALLFRVWDSPLTRGPAGDRATSEGATRQKVARARR